jgi:hypothetical protein
MDESLEQPVLVPTDQVDAYDELELEERLSEVYRIPLRAFTDPHYQRDMMYSGEWRY